MNILITGIAGFIASHLAEELMKNIHDGIIVGIDNFFNGSQDNIKYLKSLDKNNIFHFEEGDIRDFDFLNNIIEKYNIKYIYHLAAIASVQISIENPILSHDVNVKGTLNLLETSRINKIKRIIFSSSAAVYKNDSIVPKDETSPTQPSSPYGLEKLIGEEYMKMYNELYGIETVILRYFNVYGPRQDSKSSYSGVISIFKDKVKNAETFDIYGDGSQYRDFIYVKDVVKTNILAMQKENISGEIFCVGTGMKITINDIVDVLNKNYNKNIKPNYYEERKGDIRKSLASNEKIKKVFSLNDFMKFNDGVISFE